MKIFNQKNEESLTGILFILPILVLMGIWFYYPIIRSFFYSLYEISFLNPGAAEFVGLRNYRDVLRDSDFRSSLRISLVLTFVSVPVQTALALMIALSLKRIKRVRGFYRALYFLPYITSTVAVTTVFMYFFLQHSGLFTRFFALFGTRDVSWFADVRYALPFLIFICVWTYVGFYVIIFMNGLYTIPEELYEQASVEGARPFQQFFAITLPLLRPTMYLVLTSGIIFLMQIFDQPFALSRGSILGSPAGANSTMVIYFYNQAFRFNKAGFGSAAAFLIFVIIISMTVLQKAVMNSRNKGDNPYE